MSNIIKCENCGCEEIDIIHKYKGYYVCPKCGRDTERLYEIDHDKEVRAKAIDEFAERLKSDEFQKYNLDMVFETSRDLSYSDCIDAFHEYIDEVSEQLKDGGENEY